eukprot:scaffold169266_cov29-Tisochrysis_lutea.AAC.1
MVIENPRMADGAQLSLHDDRAAHHNVSNTTTLMTTSSSLCLVAVERADASLLSLLRATPPREAPSPPGVVDSRSDREPRPS